MRKIRYRSADAAIAAMAAWMMAGAAYGQSSDTQLVPIYPPYAPPSQSSVYNQNSVYLPSPPVAHGTDSVRAAAGVSCQSAVGSGGPYLDIGLIGSQDVFNRETASVYGRIVVPLGDRPKRPDCTKLYELEIARMRMELDLLRLGLPPGLGGTMAPQPASHVGEAAPATPATIAPPPSHERQSSATGAGVGEMGDGFNTIFKFAPQPSLKPEKDPPGAIAVSGMRR